ncbi:MAG: hypothetical protein AAF404_19190, partial [Pseudomonadota bacterium]
LVVLNKRDPTAASKFRIHFYGGISDDIQMRYDELIRASALEELFYFHGDVGFEESKQAQVDADYLLLIVDTGATADGVIPGKLFDYISAKRPIFALSNSTATNDIIVKGRLGTVVPVEDSEKCKQKLKEIAANPQLALISDQKYLSQYDRRALTRRLASVFDEVVESPRQRHATINTQG